MSVFIVKAFVLLREMALANEKSSRMIERLENRVSDRDGMLIELVREIRELIDAPKPNRKKGFFGFIVSDEMKKER